MGMSVTGLCDVCGRENIDHTCDRCGSLVCEKHYEPSVGYCVECAGEVGVSDPASSDHRPDETDTYQF